MEEEALVLYLRMSYWLEEEQEVLSRGGTIVTKGMGRRLRVCSCASVLQVYIYDPMDGYTCMSVCR